MQSTLIEQGLSLMLYGMGTVFVFLTILVFATSLMSSLVHRYAPQASANTDSSSVNSSQPSPQIVEAIRKAIAQHRNS